MKDWTSLKAEVARRLIRHDPIGIYFPDLENDDEYDSEAENIAERLMDCDTELACLSLIHSVFVEYFDASIAGPLDRYQQVANDIWQLRRSLSTDTTK
jgi:hypothetical protein